MPPQPPAAQAPASSPAPASSQSATAGAEREGVYEVACGCSLPSVGACGEWAKIDGAWVELEDDGLGEMPFCGKAKLKAKLRGVRLGATLKVRSIEVLPSGS